jgi:single-strand DNA-binding protein
MKNDEQGQRGAAHPKNADQLTKNMSDKIEIKGTVETILEIQEFASGFKKRTIVVNTGGKYPQMVPVDFAKEKINLLDSLAEGQEVTIGVNVRGNEYNGKYYVSLAGWKVDAGAMNAPQEEDDIPF